MPLHTSMVFEQEDYESGRGTTVEGQSPPKRPQQSDKVASIMSVQTTRWIELFPRPAAGLRLRQEQTLFEEIRGEQHKAGLSKWGPFAKERDWELAKWVMRSGTTQKDTDELLELEVVTGAAEKPSFHNARSLFKMIDRLPQAPGWSCEMFEVVGDELGDNRQPIVENLELWKRDPIECIKELISNPTFKSYMKYTPYRVFEREDGGNRCWDEMATGDWWWNMQESEDLPHDATIAPVILATDKTQLMTFSGDKQAWPIYLTIGNIDKAIRWRPSARATVLVGYLPASKLNCISEKKRLLVGYQLFHDCMRSILEPLRCAGISGIEMVCADGWVRRIVPILAAYVADFPEQCLVACCRENRCPQCMVESNHRESPTWSVHRDHGDTIKILNEQANGLNPREYERQGLRPVRPFWDNLPHVNIFLCLTPDIHHQLHKGVFKDHTVAWAISAATGGAGEIDRRFKAMPRHPTLRHFNKGISAVSQWMGNEYKNMEKVFVGIVAGVANERVVKTVRAVVDFVMFARFEMHTEATLERMDKAWSAFHENKDIFHELGIRSDFNIPKIHAMIHYVSAIHTHGTLDGYNTEAPERLHIDFAKMAYRLSNKRNYSEQMARWMARQDAVHRYDTYLRWLDGVDVGDDLEVLGVENRKDGSRSTNESEMNESEGPYTLAKKPGYGHMAVDAIVDKFGVPDFQRHLETFHAAYSLPIPHSFDTALFPVYKRFTIKLSAISLVSDLSCHKDTVRTTLPEPALGHKKPVLEQFDTVLAVEKPDQNHDVFGNINQPLKNISVAQVRIIFRLPLKFKSINKALAYVEWFTPLQRIDPTTGMYQIRRSTHMRRPRASIIPLDQILQSCHLIPKFGPRVGRDWTSENALQKAETFFLNPDLCMRDFYLLQFLNDLASNL